MLLLNAQGRGGVLVMCRWLPGGVVKCHWPPMNEGMVACRLLLKENQSGLFLFIVCGHYYSHAPLFLHLLDFCLLRQFKVSCKAIGVHPPLELSHSLVQFPGTALNDVSIATLYVTNSHISSNEFTHPVPRIGKGEIAPVGPTSFQFMVPDDSAFTISPSVGSVFPGKVR